MDILGLDLQADDGELRGTPAKHAPGVPDPLQNQPVGKGHGGGA
jgi:hypothetical protein